MTLPQTKPTATAVRSDQIAAHRDLLSVVNRHLVHPWRKPIPDHTRRAGDQALDWLAAHPHCDIVVDSFCGTGLSTSLLATRHSNACIIGVDKSANRLSRHIPMAGNYRLFRAECESFWRYLVDHGVQVKHHYMLYPNPWPKSSQLKRRVHGHPAFGLLKTLGGAVEVRSNWKIYIEEFALAWASLRAAGTVRALALEPPLTLFEQKYQQRGHTLWQFQSVANS